jgi:hypothetical protein
MSVERSGGMGGRRKHHFREMRQPSAMSADNRDGGAAQFLGNGGKMEPYTIIIMPEPMAWQGKHSIQGNHFFR